MSTLIKKEIRLLLPNAATVLALMIVLPWFLKEPRPLLFTTGIVLFFGLLMLATISFGREINMRTFASLLAQPVERRRIWRAKVTLLGMAAAMIFAAYCASCLLRIHDHWINPLGSENALLLKNSFPAVAGISGLFALMALSGGLWTTLLLRHTIAAFWVAFTIPACALMLIFFAESRLLTMVAGTAEQGIDMAAWEHARAIVLHAMLALGVLYAIAGIFFSKRLFQKAQDVEKTGESFASASGRDSETKDKASRIVRRRKPVRALLQKEFRLHGIGILFAGVLFLLHIGALLLRNNGSLLNDFWMLQGLVDYFWAFWFIAPLIIGCVAVAEERRLSVMEGQFCLPIPRFRQFLAKFLPTVISGVVIGGGIPVALEVAAGTCGAPSHFFNSASRIDLINSSEGAFILGDLVAAGALVLLGVYASTLAKSFLQALSIAIASAAVCVSFGAFVTSKSLLEIFGASLPLLASFAVFLVLPWLAWRNYKFFAEQERVLRRNVLTIACALLFMFAGSTATYHRAWEIFLPAEPAHGAPKLSLENPPKLKSNFWNGLLVQLPDGRVWFDTFGRSYYSEDARGLKALWRHLFAPQPFPESLKPKPLLAGANWVSATALYSSKKSETTNRYRRDVDAVIGIKDDGTLWIARATGSGSWSTEQWGSESNWKQVVSANFDHDLLFLKKDGTLWQATRNSSKNPDIRNTPIEQINTDSDWQKLFTISHTAIAHKINRSFWIFRGADPKKNRATSLDEIKDWAPLFRGFSSNEALRFLDDDGLFQIGIGRDGSSLSIYRDYGAKNTYSHTFSYLSSSAGTSWVRIVPTISGIIALNADGTLWQWIDSQTIGRAYAETHAKSAPTRLGAHSDWAGITRIDDRIVTLAADGSLWIWPRSYDHGAVTKHPPKQPKRLGNIFDAALAIEK